MPHKCAKRSIREKQRLERGVDVAPGQQSLENEAIPKSVARVLNAANVRQQFHTKRKADDAEDSSRPKKKQKGSKEATKEPKILPGESLQHFNKRIEQDMRHLVRTAVQTSQATTRKALADELALKKQKKNKAKEPERSPSPPPPPSPPSKHADRPKEFQTAKSSAPRRLNDIAQAPPELRFKKAVTKPSDVGRGKSGSVLSMAQKSMMEDERNKAIERYRQLKADRRAEES